MLAKSIPLCRRGDAASIRFRMGHLAVVLGTVALLCASHVRADIPISVPLFREARVAWLDGDLAKARKLLSQVAQSERIPAHHRQEAAELLVDLERYGRAGAFRPPQSFPRELPDLDPPVKFFVALDGNDENPGTAERPFRTLEKARDAIRHLKRTQGLPRGGVAVLIREGRYPVQATFRLTAEDSGTPESPILYRAAPGERPIFSGGIRLNKFRPVTDRAVLDRLPEKSRGHVHQVDLREFGMEKVRPLVLGGFASGRGFRTYPVNELYWNKKPLQLARWPNEGFARISKVSDQNPIDSWAGRGSASGPIFFPDPRLSRWANEPQLLLYGYWFWGWADSYEQVEKIDPKSGAIYLRKPYSRYGFGADRPFFALNLLCELDQPGEWYIDRDRAILYIWLPGDPDRAEVELSVLEEPLLVLEGTGHVRFEGLTWELGAVDAIHVRGAKHCVFAGCTIRCFAGDGIVFQEAGPDGGFEGTTDCLGCGVLSCDIHTLGRGGILLHGGDRHTLTRGNNFVENCHIYHLSRIDHTYTPAVLVRGVGQRVAHNLVHDIGSSAFRIDGNDHLVEFNEVFRVVMESDDQGGIDMHGDPTFRGNIFRYNYWHHLGGWERAWETDALYRAGIRLDDGISGNLIYGNIFYRASVGRRGFGGVQIHGGKDNIVDNNLFVDCMAAISFSPWAPKHWQEFISGRLDLPGIDRQLYLSRYPELARLEENPNANWIYRNAAVDCESFFLRDSRANFVGPNWVGTKEAALVVEAPGNFRVREDATIWRELGFRPIGLESIGLYQDRYRQELPLEVIRSGRAGR